MQGRTSSARSHAGLCIPVLLLCVGALGGCSSGRVNMWPLFFHEVRQVQTPDGPKVVTATDVLYPIFHRESDPDVSWYAVRPFYNYQSGPGSRRRVQYLWPLGLHFKDGSKITEHRLFPLFHFIKVWSDLRQRYTVHAHLLQLLRWGNDAQFGPYLALIPLAGITHKFIGDTWSFVAFPLFSYYRQGDYARYDFPWPILGFGRSTAGRKVMYRFFPFYVYQRNRNKQGLYVRHDLLWPLARWGKLDLGGQTYSTVLAVTPLFSTVQTWDRQGNRVAHRTTVLGISFENDKRESARGNDWGALWWLVSRRSEERRDDFRIFPFYWSTTYYRSAAKDPATSWKRVRAPWPLVWVDRSRLDPGVYHKNLVVAAFYWHFTTVYEATDQEPAHTARAITLWPLATWEQDADGGRHFWIVSHGWKDATQGFKRNYRAFFDLFQYHSTPDGQRETRVLSRLYHHRRGPNGRYLSVAGLFTYDSTAEVVGEKGKYFSALFGLLKHSWTEGESHWRLFFIPVS